MRFKINEYDLGKCFKFAIEVTKRTKHYYEKRNKYASTEKMIFDHMIGKLAEIAVWSDLHDNNKNCTYPNFKIGKGDSGDLKAFADNKEITLHVKCVRHDSPVKDSWLIEKNELQYLGENDYFALCKFFEPDEIEICKIIEANNITWREPIHKSLVTKLACYLSDIQA
jgi:hypothetical protein